ncbi:M28 family metallopeptidase [Flavobacterium faecale]|uniref:M28 family metallopeptidase n=1 Tax=Flavobacterium faecale TaxID=1355330 RepID=UPI003AAC1665
MKNKIFILIVLLTLSCANVRLTETKTVVDASTYMNSITENELKEHLYIIASDSMQGRQTGSLGQKKAADYLAKHYQKNEIPYPESLQTYFQKVPSKALRTRNGQYLNESENVCAFIKGTEKPEEIIVLSAHYDHIGTKNELIFNGADDNGTGTAALLEIAQAFKIAEKNGHKPKRSILFLHVTGEEHGLLGSKYYSENPIFPLANTVSNINIDMIGRRDVEHSKSNNYVYAIGAERLSTELYNMLVATNEKYTKLDIDYRFTADYDPNQYYTRSDHYNFAKHGIPSVFFFNGVHADYHRATDTPDKIELDALKKRTQLAFVLAWELANRENRIKVDK